MNISFLFSFSNHVLGLVFFNPVTPHLCHPEYPIARTDAFTSTEFFPAFFCLISIIRSFYNSLRSDFLSALINIPWKICYFIVNPSLLCTRDVSAQMLCDPTQCLIWLRKLAILFLSLASYPLSASPIFPPPPLKNLGTQDCVYHILSDWIKDLLEVGEAQLALMMILPLAGCVLHYRVI